MVETSDKRNPVKPEAKPEVLSEARSQSGNLFSPNARGERQTQETYAEQIARVSPFSQEYRRAGG